MSVFFINAGYPGVGSVGANGEALGLWQCVSVKDLNGLQIDEDDLAIFGSWNQGYALYEHRMKCKKARLNTSSIGQMELSNGSIELEWTEFDFKLLEKGIFDYLLFGSWGAFEYYRLRSDKVKLFPYPVEYDLKFEERGDKDPFSVGIFLPSGRHALRKNWATQKAALEIAHKMEPKLKVYSNEGGWMSDEEYSQTLSRMEAVLQCTWAESFSYATIDAIKHGTLPIISQCIADNLELSDSLTVVNPDCPMSICGAIFNFLEMDDESYNQILSAEAKNISNMAEKNNSSLKRLLEEL